MAIIGIDLGTTNSLVCVCQDGRVRLVPGPLGDVLTPSVVSVEENGEICIGAVAKERLITHPSDTAASFKRYMGTEKVFTLAGRSFTPQELSSFVLRQLKEDAERFLGEAVTEAVISVPAYFNDDQRYATREAGRLAGIYVERLINEPSAAALAASRISGQEEGSYLVFDLGGGTLDVSVVDYFENVIEIVAVSGDTHLGGNDFDECMYICAMCGQDVDCNAGQIGTVYGIMQGYAGIDVRWTKPFDDRFDSLMRGYEHTTVSHLAGQVLKAIEKIKEQDEEEGREI